MFMGLGTVGRMFYPEGVSPPPVFFHFVHHFPLPLNFVNHFPPPTLSITSFPSLPDLTQYQSITPTNAH
jgi:hypothetical protein